MIAALQRVRTTDLKQFVGSRFRGFPSVIAWLHCPLDQDKAEYFGGRAREKQSVINHGDQKVGMGWEQGRSFQDATPVSYSIHPGPTHCSLPPLSNDSAL